MSVKKIFEEIKSSKVFYSLVGLIILVIISAIIAPNFRTWNNLITIFRQASVLLVLSAGLTAVLLTGGMDLSVGATAGFIGCICAQLFKSRDIHSGCRSDRYFDRYGSGLYQRSFGRHSAKLYCHVWDKLGHERPGRNRHAGRRYL